MNANSFPSHFTGFKLVCSWFTLDQSLPIMTTVWFSFWKKLTNCFCGNNFCKRFYRQWLNLNLTRVSIECSNKRWCVTDVVAIAWLVEGGKEWASRFAVQFPWCTDLPLSLDQWPLHGLRSVELLAGGGGHVEMLVSLHLTTGPLGNANMFWLVP